MQRSLWLIQQLTRGTQSTSRASYLCSSSALSNISVVSWKERKWHLVTTKRPAGTRAAQNQVEQSVRGRKRSDEQSSLRENSKNHDIQPTTIQAKFDRFFEQAENYGNLRGRDWETADEFFNVVQQIEDGAAETVNFLKSSPKAVLLVIGACGELLSGIRFDERIATFDRLISALKKHGVPFSQLGIHHKMLKVRLENGHKFSPAEILQAMAADGLQPDAETFSYLIAQYCRDGDVTGALAIIAHMKAKQMPIAEAILCDLVYAYTVSGADDKAEQLIAQLQASNPTVSTSRLHLAMARAKAKTGDIEAMVAILDKDAETAVPTEGEAADTYEAMFKNYWLLEVFYALAENGHMEHFDKVLSKVTDYKAKPVSDFIYKLTSLGNYRAAFVFDTCASGKMVAAGTDLEALSSEMATALNDHDLRTDLRSDKPVLQKDAFAAYQWIAFFKRCAECVSSNHPDLTASAFRHLTSKIDERIFMPMKQASGIESLYASSGHQHLVPILKEAFLAHSSEGVRRQLRPSAMNTSFDENLVHSMIDIENEALEQKKAPPQLKPRRPRPTLDVEVDADRIQSLIDADAVPPTPRPRRRRTRPSPPVVSAELSVDAEGIQQLIDSETAPTRRRSPSRTSPQSQSLATAEELLAQQLSESIDPLIKKPAASRPQKLARSAPLQKAEKKKPEDPDDVAVHILIKDGKVDEAFEYALEKTKGTERERGVPGHYYLIDAAVRRNDSKFMQKLMQLLYAKNGDLNSLTDLLYVLLDHAPTDQKKMATAKKLIKAEHFVLNQNKLSYLITKATADDKPHILTGFLDLSDNPKIIDAINRDKIYGQLIYYHCTQMDERKVVALVDRLLSDGLELTDKRKKQISMAMRAFGKPDPFASPPSFHNAIPSNSGSHQPGLF